MTFIFLYNWISFYSAIRTTIRSPLRLLEFSHGFIISYCSVHVSAGGGSRWKLLLSSSECNQFEEISGFVNHCWLPGMSGGAAPGKDAWKDQAAGHWTARLSWQDFETRCQSLLLQCKEYIRKNCPQFVWEDQGVRHNLILAKLNWKVITILKSDDVLAYQSSVE